MITLNDTYAFESGKQVSLDRFVDIIGRNFKQPRAVSYTHLTLPTSDLV